MEMTREYGRSLYARAVPPRSRRAVPQPTDAERVGTQGACLYACARGHVWAAFVVRVVNEDGTRRDRDGFALRDPADAFCEEDPCSEGSDDDALGRKVSAVRHWTMR
jgi:hypothetical protein